MLGVACDLDDSKQVLLRCSLACQGCLFFLDFVTIRIASPHPSPLLVYVAQMLWSPSPFLNPCYSHQIPPNLYLTQILRPPNLGACWRHGRQPIPFTFSNLSIVGHGLCLQIWSWALQIWQHAGNKGLEFVNINSHAKHANN